MCLWIANRLHYFVEQQPVGRNSISAVNGLLSLPVSEGATCFLDNRQQRRAIPHIHYWIKHDVCAPGSHQHMAIAIAPCATRGHFTLKGFRSCTEALLVTTSKVRCQEQGLAQSRG